jgi:Ricin-type beta-trefoil lectin domain-like/HYR domain/Secretion system C-terminal sorting domain/Lectin C-type domain
MNNAYSTTQRAAKFLLSFLFFLLPLSTASLLAQNCNPAAITRTASNAKSTNTNIYDDIAFVMTNLLGAGTEASWVLETGGSFVENGDRTASFTGVIKQFGDYSAPRRFRINLTFTGQTFTAPMGSPYNTTAVPDAAWYYYTAMTGTLTGLDGLAGGVLNLNLNSMHAFQVGVGANQIPDSDLDKTSNGAAGWIEWTVASQPTTGLQFTTYNALTNIADIALLLGGTPSVPTPPCTAVAGSTTVANVNLTLNPRTATISGTTTTNSTVPTGYQTAYILTKGAAKTIVQTSTIPIFKVMEEGDYCVHVFIYNPSTLNLNTIQLGTTTAAQLLANLATNCICASLNTAGSCVTVTKPDPCAGIISIRQILNTATNCGSGTPYAMFYNNEYYVAGSDLVFTEYTNGTATITGKVVKGGISYAVNILYSGKTTTAPSMSPKFELCATAANTNNGAGWTYYPTMSGTIQTATGVVNVSRRGPSFQVGQFGNLQQATLGASGWFTGSTTLVGDFNFNIGSVLACPVTTTPPVCIIPSTPAGWMYLGSFENNNYFKFTGTGDVNYSDAKAKAAFIGGRLPIIKTAAQNAFIQSKLNGGTAWLGLNRTGTTWMSNDGTAPTYYNWSAGEPNNYNGVESAVQMKSTGFWNDVAPATFNWTIAEIPCLTSTNPCDADTQAPTLSACPANVNLTTTATCATTTWTAPTATDNCGTPSVSCSHATTFCFPVGVTTVTYTAKDAKNNTKTCSFTVTVTSSAPACNTNFDPNKCYKIVNKASGKVLDVFEASVSNNTRITQWGGHSGANQQWKFSSVGNGFVKIASRNSGKVIACHATANGSTVYQYDYYSGGYKDWKIECVSGGYYKIIHRASGKSLDVAGASTENNAKIQIWDYHGGNNQLWQIVEVPCATQGSNGTVYAANNIVFDASAAAEFKRSRIELLTNEAPQADYYTVKKADPTTGNFETLEVINNINTSSSDVQHHTTYDKSPTEGDNFYQVEITYLDGSKKVSPTQTVNFKGLLDARIFPNPAVDAVQIDLSQYAGNEVSLFIVNQFGQNVRFLPVGLAGKQAYDLDLSGIETGNYTIRIVSKGKRDLTKRLVITK